MSGKWYVVGKVCGVVATVKTLALLGIGFVGGCMLMEDGVKRRVRRTSANDAYDKGFDAGFNFAKDSYGYEFEMSRAEPRPESEDEDAEE